MKHKFYSLAKTKARTGDPIIPTAVAKAKMITHDIIQEMNGSTSSAHPFAELDLSNKDELESKRNNDGDKVAEPSGFMFEFSHLTEGVTANTNNCVVLADDHDGIRIGKASTVYNEIPMGTVASRLSRNSTSS